MEHAITYIINAKNQTDQAFKEVENNAKTLNNKIKDLQPDFKKMATIGGIAFGAISGAIGLMTKKAIEAESQEKRLLEILKTTHNATKEQVNVLLEQAGALEKVGVVSKDNVIQTQSQLATFDLQLETIKKLTPAILDYVTAEKGASATAEDFKAMTNGLAQALQGNFGSLTRVGFVLDDETKALISNGNEMERALALVEVLNSTYKGFNENLKNTTEGSLQVFKNTMENLSETIGKIFIPALNSFLLAITPIVEKIAEWVEKNPEWTKWIILTTLAMSGLLMVVGLLGLAIPAIKIGFAALAPIFSLVGLKIVAIITVIGLLVNAGFWLYKNWDKVMTAMRDWWDGVVLNFKEGVNAIISVAEVFVKIWVEAINFVIKALNKIKFSIPSWVPGIGGKSFGINIAEISYSGLPKFDLPETKTATPKALTPLTAEQMMSSPTSAISGFKTPLTAEQMMSTPKNTTAVSNNVYIEGGYYLDQKVAELIGDTIIERLKKSVKLY